MANMKKTVILFCCHYLDESIRNEFIKLKNECSRNFDVVLSYDNTREDFEPIDDSANHIFDRKKISSLDYPLFTGNIWHNADYPVLDYFLNNPKYDYYWRIEYDVRFAGLWSMFFKYFLNNKADLLGAYLIKYPEDPMWHWTKSNLNVDKESLRGIFFAVVRFSFKALKTLDEKYRMGCCGYSELIVPTLLNLESLEIQDIGKRFYDRFTFSYSSIVIKKQGKLLHPVKKIGTVIRFWRTAKKLLSRYGMKTA